MWDMGNFAEIECGEESGDSGRGVIWNNRWKFERSLGSRVMLFRVYCSL
jgi:hypothetical protein